MFAKYLPLTAVLLTSTAANAAPPDQIYEFTVLSDTLQTPILRIPVKVISHSG